MKSSLWSKVVWVVTTYRDIKKKQYPLTVLGVRLLIAAVAQAPIVTLAIKIYLPEGIVFNEIELTANDLSFFSVAISLILVISGIGLIIKESRSTARHTARVLITGLPGSSKDFPDNLLYKAEKALAREAIELSIPEAVSGEHLPQLERYNAELCVDLFKRFILHDDCKKLYIGGLARIPFLVAYGAFLRNITAQIIYFDKIHRDSSWKLLDDVDKNISFDEFQLIKIPNDNGDIGLAIGFSALISIDQLPHDLKNHTTILHPNTDEERNLIQNQDNLLRLSETVLGDN